MMTEIEMETFVSSSSSSTTNGSNNNNNKKSTAQRAKSMGDIVDDDRRPLLLLSLQPVSSEYEIQWSQVAIERRRKLQELHDSIRRKEQEQLIIIENKRKERSRFGTRLKNGMYAIGNVLQKVNVAKWIDDLEQQQEIIDQYRRQQNDEEEERQRIIAEAHDACMNAIRTHLHSFLVDDTNASYEDWIRELHPDNILINKNDGTEQLDPRYYLIDSDHRIMWNDMITQLEQSKNTGNLTSRIVEARNIME
jgi:hypothetical protein